MVDGNFTPSSVSASVGDRKYEADEKKFKMHLEEGEALPLIDGGHRFRSIEEIVESGNELAAQLPITILLHIDGDSRKDFLNLQYGRAVDKSHMMSLQASGKDNVVFSIAKLLNTGEASPFYKMIKFDSRSNAPLPISSLSGKGKSDIASSLVGATKVISREGKGADWYVSILTKVFNILKEHSPATLEIGKILCPPPEGRKGAASMLVGVANLVAYKLLSTKTDVVDEKKLLECVDNNLDLETKGNLSGPNKRSLLGKFAGKYLDDMDGDKHSGVPLDLLSLFSTSAFGLSKVPKVKAKRTGGPKKAKPKVVEPSFEDKDQMDMFADEQSPSWDASDSEG